MLIVSYCFGIRCERRLCEEVHLNLFIAGFVAWGSMARFPTIRPSRRTATVGRSKVGQVRDFAPGAEPFSLNLYVALNKPATLRTEATPP